MAIQRLFKTFLHFLLIAVCILNQKTLGNLNCIVVSGWIKRYDGGINYGLHRSGQLSNNLGFNRKGFINFHACFPFNVDKVKYYSSLYSTKSCNLTSNCPLFFRKGGAL